MKKGKAIEARLPSWQQSCKGVVKRLNEDGTIHIKQNSAYKDIPCEFVFRKLTDDDKIKVLQKIARERGWELPAHVCDYILRHYRRDLYFLCNCIKFLDEAISREREEGFH